MVTCPKPRQPPQLKGILHDLPKEKSPTMVTIVSYIVATVFSVAGCVMLFTPVKTLLSFDRKIGYQLFVNGPSEEIGFQRARWYYRVTGLTFVVVPWLLLVGLMWLV